MIEKIKNSPVARWILLIPGIIAAAALASVICNIILFIKGSGGGTWFGMEITSDDPESKVGNGMGYYIIGYLIQPAFGIVINNGDRDLQVTFVHGIPYGLACKILIGMA